MRTAADARHPDALKADILVALLPEAAAVLEADGRDHVIPSDLRDPSLFKKFGQEAHELRTAFIHRIDGELAARFPEFREAGFQPFRAFAHAFTCLHESVLFATHLIEESFRILQPGAAWIAPTPPCSRVSWPPFPVPRIPAVTRAVAQRLHGPGQPPMPRPELYFRESLYGLVLPPLCEHARIPLHRGPEAPPALSADLPPRLAALDLGRAPRDGWLFLSPAYELASMRERSRERGITSLFGPDLAAERPGFYPPFGLRRRLERAYDELFRDDLDHWDVFGSSGRALRSVLDGRMEYIFLGLIPAFWENHQVALKILERVRPRVVIGGSTGYSWEMAFLPAARALGIPRVQYCHGWSQTPYPFAWNQLPEADLYLTWEDPERGCCGSSTVRSNAVAVGSSRIEALAKRRRPEAAAAIRAEWRRGDRPVCLFVPNWVEHTRRWVNCPEEPVWQYRMQRRVFEIFERHPEIDVLWKPLLPWGFHPHLFRDPLPDHIRLVTETPAKDLMWASDLVVLDSISSPFAEAALTRAPILLLCRNPALEGSDYDLQLVQRRADLHLDLDAFLDTLDRRLTEGRFEPIAHPDDSFLRDKNINPDFTGTGGAADRALAAVERFLQAQAEPRKP